MAVSLWVLIHTVLFAASGEAFVFSSVSALFAVLGIAAVVGFADTRRKRELLLLRNIGVLGFAAPAFWVATFIGLETMFALALRIV